MSIELWHSESVDASVVLVASLDWTECCFGPRQKACALEFFLVDLRHTLHLVEKVLIFWKQVFIVDLWVLVWNWENEGEKKGWEDLKEEEWEKEWECENELEVY